jgi:hypothetical protein
MGTLSIEHHDHVAEIEKHEGRAAGHRWA